MTSLKHKEDRKKELEKMETTEKKYRLPKEFAEKWIAALRSGEYKQGQGWLVHRDMYCCLGVAGSLCGASNEEMAGVCRLETKEKFPSVPTELIGTALRTNPFQAHLINMNDGSIYKNIPVHSFPQIADWIEQSVELY